MNTAAVISAPANLEAALSYARRGWQVFPLHGIVNGRCTCGSPECSSPGKHPRTLNGFYNATSDEAKIESWFKRYPTANVAVRTGRESGIIVVDVDSQEALDSLRAEGKTLPTDTLIQQTGRGLHYFFKHPGFDVNNSASLLAPHVDVRGDGGYVAIDPSRHASGNDYKLLNDHEPQPAPPQLLAALSNNAPAKHGERTPAEYAESASCGPQADDPRTRGYVAAAITNEYTKIREAVEGTRNKTLYRAALSLGELARLGADRDDVEDTFVSAALIAGLPEDEARNTFRSGWNAGVNQPRDIPDKTALAEVVSSHTNEPAPSTEARALRFMTATDLYSMVPEKPDLLSEYIARGCITSLVAGTKVGKSTLVLALLFKLINGEPFLGKPTIKTRVVYLTEERGPTFRAALARVGVQPGSMGDNLHILLREEGRGLKFPDVMEQATARAVAVGAGLLVVDTYADWAELQGDSENQSGAVLAAMRPVMQAAASGLAVLLVRHDKKNSASDPNEAGRGSNAAAGAADILLTLRKIGVGGSNRRELQCVARFDDFPPKQIIEWNPDTRQFELLGTEADVQYRACRESILTCLTEVPASEREIIDAYPENARPSRTTLQRVLRELIDDGMVVQSGSGRRGDAFKYASCERA